MAQFCLWPETPHVKRWYQPTAERILELTHRKDIFSRIHHFIVEASGAPIGFCQYYAYAMSGETRHANADITAAYSIDCFIANETCPGRHLSPQIIAEPETLLRAETTAEKIIVRPEVENRISRKTLLAAGYCYDAPNDLFMKVL